MAGAEFLLIDQRQVPHDILWEEMAYELLHHTIEVLLSLVNPLVCHLGSKVFVNDLSLGCNRERVSSQRKSE